MLSGSGNLVKNGSNILTIANENEFGGTVYHNSGSITLGNNNALKNATLLTTSGTSLNFAFTPTVTLGNLGGNLNINIGTRSLMVGGNNGSATYAGVLSGSGSVTKNGTGTWTLGGDNTFTGGLTVNGGMVSVFSLNRLGTGAVTLNNGALLSLSSNLTVNRVVTLGAGGGGIETASSNTVTLATPFGGTGGWRKTGEYGTLNLPVADPTLRSAAIDSGAVTLGSNVSYTVSTLSVGNAIYGTSSFPVPATLTVGAGQGFSAFGEVTAGNAAFAHGTITVLGGGDFVADSIRLGTVANGKGTLSVNGAGSTVTTPGTLTVGGAGGSVLSVASGGTVQSGAAILGQANGNASANIANVTLDGAGSQWSASDISAIGGRVIANVQNGATWNSANGATFGTAGNGFTKSVTVTGTGSLLSASGAISVNRAATVLAINGGRVQSGSTTVGDRGGVGVGGSGATWVAAGGFTVDAGGESITDSGTIQTDAAYTVNGTHTSYNDSTVSAATFTGTGTVSLQDGDTAPGTLTIDQTGTSTFAGGVSGTGNFVKAGAGTLTLSGAVTNTGTIGVTGGVLIINTSLAGTGGLQVGGGGRVGGTGNLGDVAVGGGGTVAPGNSIGTLSANSLTLTGTSALFAIELGANEVSDALNIAGAFDFAATGGTYTFRFFDGTAGQTLTTGDVAGKTFRLARFDSTNAATALPTLATDAGANIGGIGGNFVFGTDAGGGYLDFNATSFQPVPVSPM